MEVADADNFFLGESAENARDDLEGRVFVIFLQPVILRNFLPEA